MRSFEATSNWIEQINDKADSHVVKVLIANKIDLQNRVITSTKGKEMADKYNMTYLETSAKDDGEGVKSLFENTTEIIAKEMIKKDELITRIDPIH